MPVSEAQRRAAVRKTCKDIKARLDKRVDKHLIGPAFYRAMLAEDIMAWLVQIDDLTSADIVTFIMNEAWDWLNTAAAK